MRILIFSGQGDVLQSAATLATAGHAAANGMRVLLVSTGPTHRLGALTGTTLGAREQELMPNLTAMEMDVLEELGQRWEQLRKGMRNGFSGRFRDITRDELPSFAGMDEVGALLVMEYARQSGRYDLVILDGPSADTLLRALALPDSLRWIVRLIFGLDRGPGQSRTSQDAALLPVAILPPNLSAPLQDLRMALEEQRALLDAATGTRIRMVFGAEEVAMPSLRQVLCGLGLYGLKIDTLILRGAETDVDQAARDEFGPSYRESRPDLLFDMLPMTPTTIQTWAERGAQLYARRDSGMELPAEAGAPPPVGRREVRLQVPFLDANTLDVALASEEVVVQLGQFRRHLLMPAILRGGNLRARIEGEMLRLWVE